MINLFEDWHFPGYSIHSLYPPVVAGGVDMPRKMAKLGGLEKLVKSWGERKAGGVDLKLGGEQTFPYIIYHYL